MSSLYTASRLRVWRQCARLHFYKYVLFLRAPETDQMAFGTVGHKALEAWYRAWKDGADRLVAALAEIDRSTLTPVDQAKLRVLIVAYDTRWGAEDWEILAVEQEFRFELAVPDGMNIPAEARPEDGAFLIGGKIDALIRKRSDGRVWAVEHKTTGTDASTGSAYWQRLSLDAQVSVYIDGATMLGYEVAGCIYDVLKRPAHELKLATPEEKREYTKGKGCSKCGGSAGGKKGIVQGRGFYDVAFASEVKRNECSDCKGTGWKLDDEGRPQSPRLHKDQRDTDETLEEFEARVVEAIGENPDAFLLRGEVVRLENELPRMRMDVIETIVLERVGAAHDLHPRNDGACSRGNRLCDFFALCANQADINQFPRNDGAHPELVEAA